MSFERYGRQNKRKDKVFNSFSYPPIASTTSSSLPDLIDGDMILEDITTSSRHKRSVLTHPQFFWPNAIVPFAFDTVHPVSKL